MMAQLSRRTDAASSHEAGRVMVDTGALAGQKAEILAMVREHPGLTSLELSYVPGCRLDRYTIAKRMSLLVEDGLVVAGEMRRQGNGRLAHTYSAVIAQAVLL